MKTGINVISNWFGLIMVVVVFSGAIAFVFTDFMNDRLNGNKRFIFVFILLAYGVYRSIRLYQSFKASSHAE